MYQLSNSHQRSTVPQRKTSLVIHSLLKQNHFSLIELLIVIVIISILASLILPVTKSVFVALRQVKCSENLKQTSLALQVYASDFNNVILLNEDSYNSYQNWAHNLSINGYLSELSNYSMTADPENSLACPEAFPGGHTEAGAQKKGTDYGKNSYTGHRVIFRSLSTAIQPSTTYFVGDSGGYISNPLHLDQNQSIPDLRHLNEWNCLFIDGHVEQLDYFETIVNTIPPGWLLFSGQSSDPNQ